MPIDTLQIFESLKPLPLSPIEGAFWRIDENLAGAYRAVVLFRLDGCIEADLLAGALRHLQYHHPKLRAVVAEGDDGRLCYYFEPAPPCIPFEIKDYDGEEFPWREETRRLLQRGFPAAGPLAAVTILRNRTRHRSDLLLLLHHAIADGLSAVMLVDDLLTDYSRAEAQLDLPPRPAAPAVTAIRAKPSGGWLSRLWLLRRFMRLQRGDKRAGQTRLPHASNIPPQSQWVHWVFSREDTLRLVRRCRKEQTSLGGALVAATCGGLMDCLPVPAGLFKCQFPLNVRDELLGSAGPVTPQDLGCFVSIMNEFYDVPRGIKFWTLARQAHQALETFVQHGGPSFGYNMAELASRRLFRRAVPRLLASEQRVTLLANNYGVLNVKDAYGSLRPRECTLTFKNYQNGPSLVIQALVMGQRLNVGLTADSLDPAFWESLHLAIRNQLQVAAAT
jgi:hypothetical protein